MESSVSLTSAVDDGIGREAGGDCFSGRDCGWEVWLVENVPLRNSNSRIGNRIIYLLKWSACIHLPRCYDSLMRAAPRFVSRCRLILIMIGCFLAPTPMQSQKTVTSKKATQAVPYQADGPHPGPAWFINVAPQAGLRMEDVNGGVDTKKYIIETTGSGVAIFDYDNDGWPDIFLVNGTTLNDAKAKQQPTSHLFHNNHDGTFSDVTKAAGLEFTGWGQGACVGDYDNDGFDDLYVTYYGKDRLYHNRGNGTFTEVATPAGVAGDGKAWGSGCAFIDYDRDGKLDLMVSNYVSFDIKTSPKPGKG